MTKHFNSYQAALEALATKGFRKLASGNYISVNGICAAHVLTTPTGAAIQFWEVR